MTDEQEGQIAVNGVDLLTNREELSSTQNRELQKYIDAHAHLLGWKDRERPPETPARVAPTNSNYSTLSKKLHSNDLLSEYKPLENPFKGRQSSRSVSPEKRNNGGEYGDYMSHTFPRSVDDNYSNYGTGGRNQFTGSNSDSLKRKGVSWSDLVEVNGQDHDSSFPLFPHSNPADQAATRPERPDDQYYTKHRDAKMSQYGSASNVSREYNMSPAYSSIPRSRDNYNRFETESHVREAAERRQREEFDKSKFGGYGDRPGSGVELTSHYWQGGQVLNDPSQLPKGPKPRRFYYSPIGDGVVAADGIELKRKPVDLSPRVTVTELTRVDRGKAGHDGLNEYVKTWSTGESAPASEFGGDFTNRISSPDAGNRDGGPQGPGGAGNKGPGRGDGLGDGAKSPFDGNRVPDGRMSTGSSMFSDPGYRYTDIQHGYAITNPRELIHQYATTTPIAVMDPNQTDNTPGTTTTATYKKKVTTRIEERQGGNVQGDTYAPYPPYRASSQTVSESRTLSPSNFVRKLRDDTMTHSQKEANTHLDTLNQRDPNANQKIQDIKQKTMNNRSHDDIDNLTDKLMEGLRHVPAPSRY